MINSTRVQDILDDYHGYLCDMMIAGLPEHKNYYRLLHDLDSKEFIWSIPMDEQRDISACNLRNEFFDVNYPDVDHYILHGPRSVLEVLAAFSRSIETKLMGEPGNDHIERWFGEMLDNLGLLVYRDSRYNPQKVDEILNIWLERRYDSRGNGSIFPLKSGKFDDRDMRQTDMWYQMQFYLDENYPI